MLAMSEVAVGWVERQRYPTVTISYHACVCWVSPVQPNLQELLPLPKNTIAISFLHNRDRPFNPQTTITSNHVKLKCTLNCTFI